MKKLVTLLLCLALTFSLVIACAQKPETPAKPDAQTEQTEQTQPDAPTEPNAPAEPDAPATEPEKNYDVADVTLCARNTNSADFMKGFSIQGTAGDLVNDEDVYCFGLAYSTANLEEVKAFLSAAPFDDPEGYVAEVDTLDLNGNIRQLAGDRKSYLDGNVNDPIRFYGDGIDLVNNVSLLQNAGEYHFYVITFGYEKTLGVAEASETFVMEQSAIDLSNAFADAFDLLAKTTLREGEDVSAMTQDEKTAAVQAYFAEKIAALGTGIEVSVVYENDEQYPDDYLVTLTKDGVESSDYVTVFFGEAKE